MSRVQRNKDIEKRRKKLIYPAIAFVVAALILIVAIDFRINSTLGTGGVRIIGVQRQDSKIALSVFNEEIANINFEFVKRDIMRLKRRVFEYVNEFENLTREVFKQY